MDLFLQKSLLEKHRPEFEKYLRLLLKWNKIHNLTAITKEEEIWEKHFLDSLAPIQFLQNAVSLLDIGTGAGFPGIPLKIARPALSVTLVEATKKKCSFCEAVIRELGLKDIRVVHGRAEDKEIQKKLDKFDAVVSRATLSLKKLILYCHPFLKNNPLSPPFRKGGLGGIYNQPKIIAMKGRDCADELKDAAETISRLKLKIIAEKDYKHGRLIIISR